MTARRAEVELSIKTQSFINSQFEIVTASRAEFQDANRSSKRRGRRRPFPEGANQDSPNLQQLIKLCSRMPRHPPHCPSSSFSTWRIALPSCASLFHLSDRLFVLRNTDMQEKAKARLRELAPRGQKEPGGRINTT